MEVSNVRMIGESFSAYRWRLRVVAKTIKAYLRYGAPAMKSKDGRRYVPGPHRSHQPHEIKQFATVFSRYGVPEEKLFSVVHPGTLYKEKAK